jgi:hypothetical protein
MMADGRTAEQMADVAGLGQEDRRHLAAARDVFRLYNEARRVEGKGPESLARRRELARAIIALSESR